MCNWDDLKKGFNEQWRGEETKHNFQPFCLLDRCSHSYRNFILVTVTMFPDLWISFPVIWATYKISMCYVSLKRRKQHLTSVPHISSSPYFDEVCKENKRFCLSMYFHCWKYYWVIIWILSQNFFSIIFPYSLQLTFSCLNIVLFQPISMKFAWTPKGFTFADRQDKFAQF